MLKALTQRLQQGHRTVPFPAGEAALPERFIGRPQLERERCASGCQACQEACPTQALSGEGSLSLDLGRCLFCRECERACPDQALTFTAQFAMATRERAHLVLQGSELELARALDKQARRVFARSLRLREVSAAGCNGCEAEVNALSNVVFDLARFGVGFVASPRHADGLLITGPVSQNMRAALLQTYQAVPAPRLVVAVGACAISGGPYRGHPQVCNGVEGLLKVDLYVPGCPPHPLTILDGLLRLLGRLP